ncbi:hypothetical protein HDU93_003362 [Gonapodya sp. JEL0774]|nr:hypothetical protein HDU93_003362 [Gonapodya sp. JEL0774]
MLQLSSLSALKEATSLEGFESPTAQRRPAPLDTIVVDSGYQDALPPSLPVTLTYPYSGQAPRLVDQAAYGAPSAPYPIPAGNEIYAPNNNLSQTFDPALEAYLFAAAAVSAGLHNQTSSLCARYLAHLISFKDAWEILDAEALGAAVAKFWSAERKMSATCEVEGQIAEQKVDRFSAEARVEWRWSGDGAAATAVCEVEALVYSVSALLPNCFRSSFEHRYVTIILVQSILSYYSNLALADGCTTSHELELTKLVALGNEIKSSAGHGLGEKVDIAGGILLSALSSSVSRLTHLISATMEMRDYLSHRQPLPAWHTWLRRLVETTLFTARMTPLRGDCLGNEVPVSKSLRPGSSARNVTKRGTERLLWDAVGDLLMPMREAMEMLEVAGCSALQIDPLLLRGMVQLGFFDPVGMAIAGARVTCLPEESCVRKNSSVPGNVDVVDRTERKCAVVSGGEDDLECRGTKRSFSLAFGRSRIRDDFNVRNLPHDSATAHILRAARKPHIRVIPAQPPAALIQLQARHAFMVAQQQHVQMDVQL